MTDYFIRKGETPALARFVTITERRDGNVHFANAWGGYGYYAPENEFGDRFEQVPEATVKHLLGTYSPITVTALEGDGAMDGFTNGQKWNGFEVPLFTKETVLEALADGGHLATPDIHSNTRFFFDATTNDLYEITTEDGDIPADFNMKVIEQFLTEPRKIEEIDAFAETLSLRINPVHRTAIVIDGESEPAVVYAIGNGWCWEKMERFEKKAETSAPRM
ncbi:hypothetical protein O9X98_06305 [Agrobacterium salinitolerans]|nr:hypothetical protein [Agrobacterium salinitolerans]